MSKRRQWKRQRDWLDMYADNPYNEMLAAHERAEARVAVDSDGEDSGVQLTVSVATNILTSNDQKFTTSARFWGLPVPRLPIAVVMQPF